MITPIAVKDKQLNNCKAQGPDGIPPRVLKEVSENLAIPLSILFNKSLEKGLIPADWKQAEVVAVFNPLPGATSENVRAGPWAERPKTSGRDR